MAPRLQCRVPARRGRAICLGLIVAILFQAGPAAPAAAGEPNRAGLAVLFGDGTLVTRCVEFEGDTITGSELLAHSGLEYMIDSTHGGGITVCKIETTGCDYPAAACFCQCMGNGPCRYWNYYYRELGQSEWTYSTLGALLHKSTPGSVEAWVWGDGHTPPDQTLTLESICAPPPTSTPAPTATASIRKEPKSTPAPTGTAASSIAALTPTASPVQGPSPVPTPALGPEELRGGWRSYWPFGLMLLVLAAIAVYLRAGRRV